jgi:hypothetical protein
MPVQHFAQPTASTIDTKQPITEIRWDFAYEKVEILESGHAIAQINNPNLLLGSGIEITANSGDRFVLHIKKDTSAGPFVVFRNDIELVGGIPSWGVASSVAGKMVHLPTELFQEKMSIRNKLERPIRIAQSWMGFLSLTALAFAYLSGIGSHYVPNHYLSSVKTPLFSGAIAALGFMALALITQKRTAFFVLPIAQIFTIVQAMFMGNALFDSPKYPHFVGFRIFVSALCLWVMADSWKTIRGHRGEVRLARKQNQIGLDEIEKTTVRDLEKIAGERGHLLAWQQNLAETRSGQNTPDSPTPDDGLKFPSAMELVLDGEDPFASNSPATQGSNASAENPPSTPTWMNRNAPASLDAGIPSVAAPNAHRSTGLRFGDAQQADFSLARSASAWNQTNPTAASLDPLQTLRPEVTRPSTMPAPNATSVFPVSTESSLLVNEPEAWVPPATPQSESVEPAKPSTTHHPLRSRVRSGL